MTVSAVVSALVVDCAEPARLAAFWQRILGGRVISYPALGVEALRAPGVTFDFVKNPDKKIAKNRWHLDLAADSAEATLHDALAAGATRATEFEVSEDFVVMQDPEGNEFCILRHAATAVPWVPPPQATP
jgi:hypothetical protein